MKVFKTKVTLRTSDEALKANPKLVITTVSATKNVVAESQDAAVALLAATIAEPTLALFSSDVELIASDVLV